MATISQAQWKRYIARLRKINDTAAEEFRKIVIDKGGYGNIERQKLIDYAYGISTKYGEASAALSAEMYDAIAELSGAAVPAALPAETASYSEVSKTINGILKKSQNEDFLASGVGRLVKMAGTDTILSNAYRDRPKGKGSKRRHSGAQVAWIPFGDTCPFCLMLASKGWVNQTEWGANSHSEHIHSNCDCTYAVRFNKDLSFEGYDPDEYKAIYDNAEGKTRNEKFKSMRHSYYSENQEKINLQKRIAYAKREDKLEMYRREKNVGAFSDLEELMTNKHVRGVVADMGLDPKDVLYKIDRREEMLKTPYSGVTADDGKSITLFPNAFKNREVLVKTIGHENVHLNQVRKNGKVVSTEDLKQREIEASDSEERWWKDYVKNTGYRPGR